MPKFQVFRLDREIVHFIDPITKARFQEIVIRTKKLFHVWAITPEEALAMAQSDHPFPRRLCVEPLPE